MAPTEPETISEGDDDATIARRVAAAIGQVPGAIGLNNHQGSLATADRRVVRAVLSVVRERGLFFLDSRTSAASVAAEEARDAGPGDDPAGRLPRRRPGRGRGRGRRSSGSPRDRLVARPRARRLEGHAVVIGHPHAATVDFLATRLPALDGRGVLRVKVSELVD